MPRATSVCVLALFAATPALSLTVTSLAQRASALPWSCAGELEGFAFQSAYAKGGVQRGWANWLVEERVMLGQYPHCQPAEPGPSADDAQAHLRSVLAAGVDCFACLQAELPPQDEPEAWPAGGVQLPEAEDRARWPARFVRYAAEADAIAAETGGATVLYLHCPIEDLSVPRMPELLALLDQLLAHYEQGGQAVYVHCWGGRGRAGVVGACLLSLLQPGLDAPAVLEAVQSAYDSRSGAGATPSPLKRSPQTERQRSFVRSFVSAVRASRRYLNDLEMSDAGGMPRGYL